MTAIDYRTRTRDYYRALGYERDYRWAQHDDAPFAPLPCPLGEATLALVTTATPTRDGATPVLPKAVHSFATTGRLPKLYTDDLAWDRVTHLRDTESWLPIERLREAARAGRIGRIAPRIHGVPTDYSQRRTMEIDAPELLRRCREDEVDVALLVPL